MNEETGIICLTGKYVNEKVEGLEYDGFIQFTDEGVDKKIFFLITLKKKLSEWSEEEFLLNSYKSAEEKIANISAHTSQDTDVIKNNEFVKAVLLSLSLPSVVYFYKEKKKSNEGTSTFFVHNISTDRVTDVFSNILKSIHI